MRDNSFSKNDCNIVFFTHFGCRIAVPQFGLMHLDLIPMLVGFFTYKIATFTQAIEDALPVAEKKTET